MNEPNILLFNSGNLDSRYVNTTGDNMTGNLGITGDLTVSGSITQSGSTLADTYVNVTGDTMTGGLTIEPDTDTLTALVVNDTDSNNVLTVDTINNRVGIGTTEPERKLHINSSGDDTLVHLSSPRPVVSIEDTDIAPWAYFGYGSSGDAGALVFSVNRDFASGVFSDTGKAAADFKLFTDDNDSYIQFRTSPTDNTTPAEAMRIDKNGNVGIGVTDPDTKLEVLHAGNQLKLSFDATDNAVFAVDTAGDLTITPSGAQIIVPCKLSFTQTDGNEYIDSLADGYLDFGATTGHRFNAPITIADKTLLGTPVAGTFEFDNDRMYVTNVGSQRAIDRTSDTIVETTTITNTTDETTIYTGAIGANCLKAGNILKLHCDGVLTNDSASDDVTVKIYLGSSEVLSFKPALGNVTDTHWHIDGNMTVRTVGDSGTMAFHLDMDIDDNVTSMIGTDSVDTTAAEDFTVTITWDNAKAGNTISIYQGYTEWKN